MHSPIHYPQILVDILRAEPIMVWRLDLPGIYSSEVNNPKPGWLLWAMQDPM